MSGHSKWKNNLNKKSANDTKRSVNFAKLSRAITLAVLEGNSSDPEINARLRVAIEKARSASMPKDNIDRAIAKASGPDNDLLTRVMFEIIAPHSVAILALGATDNANRTHGEIRSLVERHNAKLGSAGVLRHLFMHGGSVGIANDTVETDILEAMSLLVADDMQNGNGVLWLYFPYEKLGKASGILSDLKIGIVEAPHESYRPHVPVALTQEDMGPISHLLELLDSHDDIHELFTNIE